MKAHEMDELKIVTRKGSKVRYNSVDCCWKKFFGNSTDHQLIHRDYKISLFSYPIQLKIAFVLSRDFSVNFVKLSRIDDPVFSKFSSVDLEWGMLVVIFAIFCNIGWFSSARFRLVDCRGEHKCQYNHLPNEIISWMSSGVSCKSASIITRASLYVVNSSYHGNFLTEVSW